jgi:hypothetical protein
MPRHGRPLTRFFFAALQASGCGPSRHCDVGGFRNNSGLTQLGTTELFA